MVQHFQHCQCVHGAAVHFVYAAVDVHNAVPSDVYDAFDGYFRVYDFHYWYAFVEVAFHDKYFHDDVDWVQKVHVAFDVHQKAAVDDSCENIFDHGDYL